MVDGQQPLKWLHDKEDPEQQRTHTAHELVEAIHDGRAIEINAAVIIGDVDLGNISCARALVIRDSVFTGHVNLSEGRFARTVDFGGCEFQHDLNFFDARIDGQLVLSHVKISRGIGEPHAENFACLEVSGRVNASCMESEVDLCFAQAEIGASADFRGIKVNGDLDFRLAKVDGHLSCDSTNGRRTEVVGRVSLANVRVGGEVRFDGAKIGWESQTKSRREALSLESAVIDGHLVCDSTNGHVTEILGTMSLRGATMGGNVSINGIKIGREADSVQPIPVPGQLDLSNVRIAGNLLSRPAGGKRAEILGTVSLQAGKVDGLIRLDGIKIGPEARSKYDQEPIPGRLFLQDAEVGGSIYCKSLDGARAEIIGSVSLVRTTVGGSVFLQGAKIGQESQALEESYIKGRLDLSHAKIGGDVVCSAVGVDTVGYSDRTEILGPVLLFGTQVARDVNFDGIRIGREGQFPDVPAVAGELDLRDVNIVGDLLCSVTESKTAEHSYRAEIHGPVSLLGGKVDGQVLFLGALIGSNTPEPDHVGRPALNLQSVHITGGLSCCPKGNYCTEIHGDVYTGAAKILCAGKFDRARIHGDLNMERTAISGPLLCAYDEERYDKHPDDSSKKVPGHFQVDGKLKLTGSQVQDVVLDGRMFGDRPALGGVAAILALPIALLVDCLVFLIRLFIGQRDPRDNPSRLWLDRANFSKLQFKETIPDKIHADGLSVSELELPGRPFEYTELLKRTQPFRKSSYLDLEDLLLNKGLDAQARRVYVAMSTRDLMLGRNFLDRWFRWLVLGIPIAYGARPSRLFWFILITFLLTLMIFKVPESLIAYHPYDPNVTFDLPSDEPTWTTTIDVALQYHFPMFHVFRGNPSYAPSTDRILEIPELDNWVNVPPSMADAVKFDLTYRMYALLISAISWVVVPLWVAGLTGVVRRRRITVTKGAQPARESPSG